MDLTTTEPFSDTFGVKAQRKRPRLDVGSIAELASKAASQQASTSAVTLDTPADASTEDTEQSRAPEDIAAELENAALNNVPRDYILSAGTSRRIWGELYKVHSRSISLRVTSILTS
jgi:nuclear GTP-binding protein